MPDEPISRPAARTPDTESTPVRDEAASAGNHVADGHEKARPDAAGRSAQPGTHPDPTRYGDWEKGGRCIDF